MFLLHIYYIYFDTSYIILYFVFIHLIQESKHSVHIRTAPADTTVSPLSLHPSTKHLSSSSSSQFLPPITSDCDAFYSHEFNGMYSSPFFFISLHLLFVPSFPHPPTSSLPLASPISSPPFSLLPFILGSYNPEHYGGIEERYKVSICTKVKNEAKYIEEWLLYYWLVLRVSFFTSSPLTFPLRLSPLFFNLFFYFIC